MKAESIGRIYFSKKEGDSCRNPDKRCSCRDYLRALENRCFTAHFACCNSRYRTQHLVVKVIQHKHIRMQSFCAAFVQLCVPKMNNTDTEFTIECSQTENLLHRGQHA